MTWHLAITFLCWPQVQSQEMPPSSLTPSSSTSMSSGWRGTLSGHPPERRNPARFPHLIDGVAAIEAVSKATLRASHADVRAGRMSEARPRSAAEDQPNLDRRTPQILIWGMGGATAILPVATAARRARTGADNGPDGRHSNTVTVISTRSSGLSLLSFGTLTILSATPIPFTTSPNAVYLRSRNRESSTTMKN